tara:strand:- start:145 stop:2598 length:2454 start_codon:yes stop_codon:yes gene_type:complete
MELTSEQVLQKGVTAHKEGKLQEAERLYRLILKYQPLHPDANHNLGLIEVSVDKTKAALTLFKNAIEANPKIEQFWLSYIDTLIKEKQFDNAKKVIDQAKKKGMAGDKLNTLVSQLPSEAHNQDINSAKPSKQQINSLLEYWQTGQYSNARNLAISITKIFPTHQFAWKVLGVAQKEEGRLRESLDACQKSVHLKPQDAEAHSNLGNTLQELGMIKEAEASYSQAIMLNPYLAIAHYNQGCMFEKMERLDAAEKSYTKVIALKPNYIDAHNNLGVILNKRGDIDGSIDSFIKALRIMPEDAKANSNMAVALQSMRFKKSKPGIKKIILKILNDKNIIRPSEISTAVTSLLKLEPIVKAVFEIHSEGKMKLSIQKIVSDLSDVPLLLKIMSVSLLSDLDFEALLKDIRSVLLSSISEIKGTPKVLKFQSALALHCFTNEYVYFETNNDFKALEILETEVKELLLNKEQPSPQAILCLASYKALYDYEWFDLLTVTDDIKQVITRQVVEPKQESHLKLDIPLLQEITDNVSLKVREQYEENPYPRWISLGLPLKSHSVSEFARNLHLNIFDLKINNIENPDILVAGCGTGEHSIETASIYKNSTVLAVDLSLASLAYAKRKTQESNLQNIQYMQADILDLGKLDMQFDIVESVGVLHHMYDPMAGWKVLTDCLKSAGLMRIGLYSELARQSVVKIREEILQLGIGSSDDAIRKFRSNIIDSNEDHHKRILKFNDFYSTSELRDLLFHMQEHRFTIPEIKVSLADLGLKFCGFSSKNIVQNFKLTNTGKDDPYDLDKWILYEEANPHTFAAMYQFWCQKL